MPTTVGFEHIDPTKVIVIDGDLYAVTPATERAAAIGAMLTAMGSASAAQAIAAAKAEAARAR